MRRLGTWKLAEKLEKVRIQGDFTWFSYNGFVFMAIVNSWWLLYRSQPQNYDGVAMIHGSSAVLFDA